MVSLDKQIFRLPVVILSSKRTGSTFLTYYICELLKNECNNLHQFIEPSESNQMQKLLEVIDNNENYVLKMHAYDLITKYSPKVKNIINTHNCFLIRIRRRNILDQLTSYYIANERNIWEYSNNTQYDNTVKKIDMDRIKRIINRLYTYNQAIDNFPEPFDVDIYYEDLPIVDGKSIKTPAPENYDEIRNSIYHQMENAQTDNKNFSYRV